MLVVEKTVLERYLLFYRQYLELMSRVVVMLMMVLPCNVQTRLEIRQQVVVNSAILLLVLL